MSIQKEDKRYSLINRCISRHGLESSLRSLSLSMLLCWERRFLSDPRDSKFSIRCRYYIWMFSLKNDQRSDVTDNRGIRVAQKNDEFLSAGIVVCFDPRERGRDVKGREKCGGSKLD
jgi:hypothetical protein